MNQMIRKTTDRFWKSHSIQHALFKFLNVRQEKLDKSVF